MVDKEKQKKFTKSERQKKKKINNVGIDFQVQLEISE